MTKHVWVVMDYDALVGVYTTEKKAEKVCDKLPMGHYEKMKVM